MIERYSRKILKDIWDEENKYTIWLNIEIAAAEAMEKLKVIPKGVAKKVKAKFAISCNSGSSDLHLACRALNLKKNDLVWTVPNTYAATANCALECGAKIDFVDIDPKTWNISIEQLEKKLKTSKNKNKLPKVLILVHLAGLPNELEKINRLSKKYNFKVIEDASHAIGASYKKNPVGNCKWSDLTVFSFHPVKIITSGEGGAITTNNNTQKNFL